MRLALALLITLMSACADLKPGNTPEPAGSLSVEAREALLLQAREGARQARERYIATTRPVLQRQFQQEYPTMPESEIETLVTDALEKGLHPEAKPRRDGPSRQHQMDCLSSPWRNSAFANCY
ncbi:MAG: hypothetical protein IPM58_07395 [Nitrospira sp.]|nr:hypothetical protein [Nitrospira sp.]